VGDPADSLPGVPGLQAHLLDGLIIPCRSIEEFIIPSGFQAGSG